MCIFNLYSFYPKCRFLVFKKYCQMADFYSPIYLSLCLLICLSDCVFVCSSFTIFLSYICQFLRSSRQFVLVSGPILRSCLSCIYISVFLATGCTARCSDENLVNCTQYQSRERLPNKNKFQICDCCQL